MRENEDLENSTVILNKYESDEFLDFASLEELKQVIKTLDRIMD